MLTMVGVALATIVVVGIVKVLRMQNKMENMQSWIVENHNHVLQRISSDITNIENVISDDRRELNQRSDELYRYTDNRFDTEIRDVHLKIEHIGSYVDSRFDKFENKLNERFEASRKILETVSENNNK